MYARYYPIIQVTHRSLFFFFHRLIIARPSAELFVTSDLYNNKHFQAVLDNLLAVARVAHAQDDYDGPQLAAVVVPSAEAKKRRAKKHREVNPQPAGMWNEQAPETPETALRRQLEEQMEAHVRLQQ